MRSGLAGASAIEMRREVLASFRHQHRRPRLQKLGRRIVELTELSRQIAAQGDQWIVAGSACQAAGGGLWRCIGSGLWWSVDGGGSALDRVAYVEDGKASTDYADGEPDLQDALASGPLATDAASVGALRLTMPERYRPARDNYAPELAYYAPHGAHFGICDETTAILAAFLAWQKAGAPC